MDHGLLIECPRLAIPLVELAVAEGDRAGLDEVVSMLDGLARLNPGITHLRAQARLARGLSSGSCEDLGGRRCFGDWSRSTVVVAVEVLVFLVPFGRSLLVGAAEFLID